MPAELIVIALAFTLAAGLAHFFPDATKMWFQRIMSARKVVSGILTVVIALVFIGSGVPALVLVGFVILLFVGLYLAFEEPWEVVSAWT